MSNGEMSKNAMRRWWVLALRYFERRCAYCRKPGKLTRDHYIPRCLGGPYHPLNIVPACRLCQKRKGSKHPRWSLRRSDNANVAAYFKWLTQQLEDVSEPHIAVRSVRGSAPARKYKL